MYKPRVIVDIMLCGWVWLLSQYTKLSGKLLGILVKLGVYYAFINLDDKMCMTTFATLQKKKEGQLKKLNESI